MNGQLDIVIVGLTISSAWGNGHATTYRALVKGLAALGHRVTFLERDMPWYAGHRDVPRPEFCDLHYYHACSDLEHHRRLLEQADAVIIGSYVPSGAEVIDRIAGYSTNSLCFYDIDTPVTLARLEGGDEEFLAKRQIPLFDAYLSFAGGHVLERLVSRFDARRAVPLYCSVDPSIHRPTGERPCWDLGYLGTYSPDRQPVLETLLLEPARMLPDKRFVVAGSSYPEGVDWPANVERIEHLPPHRHASFYSRQRFTLNVTRADMVATGWSPSVRLFEAAACGTPIISDRWEGLTELLPEDEAVLVPDSTSAVVDLLTAFPQSARAGLAARARRIVLSDHTGTARAQELVRYLRAIGREAPVPHPSIAV